MSTVSKLHELPETTVFREYILRSRNHDPTARVRMDEEIYIVQIVGSKTYWGVAKGDFQDSDIFLLITPACLNRGSELPHIDERNGKLAFSLTLRCLCELFNHLRPDEAEDREGRIWDREGYWGIDCNEHKYIYNKNDTSIDTRDKSIHIPLSKRAF